MKKKRQVMTDVLGRHAVLGDGLSMGPVLVGLALAPVPQKGLPGCGRLRSHVLPESVGGEAADIRQPLAGGAGVVAARQAVMAGRPHVVAALFEPHMVQRWMYACTAFTSSRRCCPALGGPRFSLFNGFKAMQSAVVSHAPLQAAA